MSNLRFRFCTDKEKPTLEVETQNMFVTQCYTLYEFNKYSKDEDPYGSYNMIKVLYKIKNENIYNSFKVYYNKLTNEFDVHSHKTDKHKTFKNGDHMDLMNIEEIIVVNHDNCLSIV